MLLENGIIRHSLIVVIEQPFSQNRFGGLLVLVVEDSFCIIWLVESDESFEVFIPGLRVGISWCFSKLKFKLEISRKGIKRINFEVRIRWCTFSGYPHHFEKW